jgi:hypothetical protein
VTRSCGGASPRAIEPCAQAVSGMAAAAPRELGAEFPFLVSALQTHSKLLHGAIEGDAPPDMVHALFSQVKMLQRAAGCGGEDLSLVDYQYGTWTYAETDDLQLARDTIQQSLQARPTAAASCHACCTWPQGCTACAPDAHHA